uniref:Uncharacterized protein n=1 Tax=Panagrolaimus davidi TaxID=227884 RepID=A0A914P9S6_9BILA
MMRRYGESSSPISKKKLLSFDERRKILNHISIFGTSKSCITLKYDAADYLHAEFSTKFMPLSVLMKSINLITEIYVEFDKNNGERVSIQLLIWPATKILHGIILHQKNPKVLNVIIADLIPLICNKVMSKIHIPSPDFEMFTCLISSFCLRNSAARHKIRTTSFPSTLIDLLGKRKLSSNDFRNTGTLLSIMEEDDIEFDNVVTTKNFSDI